MSSTFLNLRIIAKNKIMFEGQVQSVSSHNAVGNFDILPEHSSFVSLIDTSVGYMSESGKQEAIQIQQGLLKVINNQVTVLIEF